MKRITALSVSLIVIAFVSSNVWAKKSKAKDDGGEQKTEQSKEAESSEEGEEDSAFKSSMKEVGEGFKGMGRSFKDTFGKVKEGTKEAFGGKGKDGGEDSEDSKKEKSDE